MRTARRRPGYTLLEILVATVIALLLMTGLYVAFDVTLSQTDTGRELVREADLGRAVFNRMNLDLAFPVGPLPPKSGGGIDDQADSTTTPSTSGTTSGTTTGGTTTGGTTTGGTTTGTDTTTTTTDTGSADAQSTIAASIPLQAGVIGSSNQLTLFVSKVPPWLLDRTGTMTADQQVAPDLRKITYYIGNNGGLCRQERAWVTADGVQNTLDPDRSTEADDLIAIEVSAVNFEYADGTGWTSTWDGSYASTDGTSTQGPPRAIRVTLTLDLPDNTGKIVKKQIQHVFAVRAAVGLAAPPEPPPADPNATTTGGTG